MSILFGGGEDEAINMLGGTVVQTAGTFRTPQARCSLRPSGAGLQHVFTGKLAAYLAAQPDNDKDFWYGFYFKGGGGFLSGQPGWFFDDDSGKPFLRIKGNATANGLIMETSSDGATFTSYAGSSTTQPGAPTEMTVRIKKSVNGYIAWYYGTALLFQTPTFDTTVLIVGSPHRWRGFIPNSNGDGYYSEFIAMSADDPRVGLTLNTIPPSALGALQQWSGPVTAINEVVKDQTTAQSTAAADVSESFVVPGTLVIGGGTEVRGVIWSGEYRTAALPAPQNVEGFLRIGGTLYPAAMQAVAAVAGLLQFIWETDPSQVAGTKFDVATINAMQPGNTART